MELWGQALLLCMFSLKAFSNFRDVMVSKITCTNSSQLAVDQSFTPVTGVAECVHLYLASAALFMLVRYAAEGTAQCGHTSTLPRQVSCSTAPDGVIIVYADSGKSPMISPPYEGNYTLRGITLCVHNAQTRMNYDDAEQHCSFLGGMVVEMEKREDLSFFHDLDLGIFFVAADDHKVHGEYRWKNSSLVHPSFFRKNEPDRSSEHCLAFHSTDAGLLDVSCDSPKRVMCAISCQ